MEPEASTQSAPQPTKDTEGYAPVEGRDAKSMELERTIEARAHAKVASDHAHIVWSYGILWALFAGYVLILWRSGRVLRADAEALRARLEEVAS